MGPSVRETPGALEVRFKRFKMSTSSEMEKAIIITILLISVVGTLEHFNKFHKIIMFFLNQLTADISIFQNFYLIFILFYFYFILSHNRTCVSKHVITIKTNCSEKLLRVNITTDTRLNQIQCEY